MQNISISTFFDFIAIFYKINSHSYHFTTVADQVAEETLQKEAEHLQSELNTDWPSPIYPQDVTGR